MSKHYGKNGVLLVTAGPDFDPRHTWDLPSTIVAGELVASNQFLCDCLGYCRLYNAEQLRQGLPGRKWAIPIRRGHFYCRPVPPATGLDQDDQALAQLISREMVVPPIAAAGGNCRVNVATLAASGEHRGPGALAGQGPFSSSNAGSRHRGPGALAGQGDAVLPPLRADLEVTPAALLTESCS